MYNPWAYRMPNPMMGMYNYPPPMMGNMAMGYTGMPMAANAARPPTQDKSGKKDKKSKKRSSSKHKKHRSRSNKKDKRRSRSRSPRGGREDRKPNFTITQGGHRGPR